MAEPENADGVEGPGPAGSETAGSEPAQEDTSSPERAGSAEGASRRSALDRSLGNDALPASVRCPFCGRHDTEQFAAFGSAVSTSQYYCRRCRTVFEYMKRGGGGRTGEAGS